MVLASSDKLSENFIHQKEVNEIPCWDNRLSVLYYINVNQMQIRKEAYDYFYNLQKNIEQTGSIFSPVPSEMKGNIVCSTNPDLPVIGYVDVTSKVEKDFFHNGAGFYEAPMSFCDMMITSEFEFAYPVYSYYEVIPMSPTLYAPHDCVDCRRITGATKEKPDFWPNDHY